MIANMLLIIFIPFLLGSIAYYYYMKEKITQEHKQKAQEILISSSELINAEINKYITRSKSIVANKHVASGIRAFFEWDPEEVVNFQSRMADLTGDLYYSFDKENFSTFNFYIKDENIPESWYIANINKLNDENLIEKILKSQSDAIIWRENVKQDYYGRKYITFYRNMTNIINKYVILEVNIPYENIERYINTIKIIDNVIIVHRDSFGNILDINYKNDSKYNFGEVINQDYSSFIALKKGLIENSGSMQVLIPKAYLKKEYLGSMKQTFGMFIILMALFAVASISTTFRITNSLEKFINNIKDREDLLSLVEADFEMKEITMDQIDYGDEVVVIKKKFIGLLKLINQTYRELIQKETQNSMLELELLQSRINPHLLYNSHSVIRWKALKLNDKSIVDLIDSLTRYYRVALNKGNNLIPMRSELNMLRDYINIVNMSYNYEHKLKSNIEDDLLDVPVLKHLLQPIVENAVVHGLAPLKKNGEISINAYKIEDKIAIEVKDNGMGIPKDKIEKIQNISYESAYGGYGIKNTIKRIKYYYGEDCGVYFESEGENCGTLVKVVIKHMSQGG